MSNSSKQTVEQLLSLADVKIDGRRAFDIKVNDERLYDRVLRHGTLGLGEAYMDGWWEAKRVDELISRLLTANLRDKAKISPSMALNFATGYVLNRQSVKRARHNAAHHYNIGNDLYERMLDKRMIYSCGYWRNAKTLDEAQTAKLDLVCRKLHLKKGMKLLDIGCGWGGFAEYAARQYGVVVTGISPAAEQVKLAKKRTKGLPVTILQKDYRHMTGSFDRIVSIGMLEHVGPKNYGAFFKRCHRLLKDGGIMLHHTIGSNRSTRATEPWIDKYIFPGGVIPAIAQIAGAVEKRLIVEDIHNFGPYYDRTLMAWHANFVKHYPEISDHYDERFYRMWNYYLLSCAGAFRARHLQLWQIVMRKIETADVYEAVR
ncbi:MAG TPA: cyclopropane fatty acyl phospholipid synthase [Candidatus Saccharimonadales bacterium]|nr:cyclopropane fatty acyl phospholipid synthase [Candidatus Saccharimonadales bacterium]